MPGRETVEPAQSKQRAYSAPALEKGIDVLELLGGEPSGLSIGEMAARMGRSISELFRVVIVLDRRGWLRKDAATDRYRVTYKVLEAAHRATPAQELIHVAAPLMHALAATVEQSCHMVVLNDGTEGARGLVVLRQESPGQTGFAVRLGTSVDLASSCSGHVLLAFASAEKRAALLAATKGAPGLSARIDRVREHGHECIPSARMAGVSDMSCPIFGFDGQAVAALTIPFLEAIDGAAHVSRPEALDALKATAARISTALGWYDRGDEPGRAALPTAAPTRRRRAAAGRA
ncbi:IclR family transcriptional regulator [Sphingomonas sp.]|jgi:DNA-binding IclR family transcriptional regulator|uniref:IclR family transcriptional regulator n=1 Tax=Sphingomonas sp. TaxID=28214 RepID=UPI002ED9CCE6